MKYPLAIQPEAEGDLDEAYRWYAVVYRTVRQTLVRRFPYVVCYVFEENRVEVLAVFHGQRDPASWKLRVDLAGTEPSDDNSGVFRED